MSATQPDITSRVRGPHRCSALILLAAGLATGCGADSFRAQPQDAAVVRVGGPRRVLQIAPRLGWSYYQAQVAQYVFEGLTRIEEDGSLVPALARAWSASPDGRTYRFLLRSGVTFHDGSRFAAADVVAAWERAVQASDDPAVYPWMLDPIDGVHAFAQGIASRISGLTVEDDTTLVVRLADPLAFFPTLLSLPQAAIACEDSHDTHPIGTGPWRFVSLDSTEIRFAANDAYWDARPGLDSLLYRYVRDSLMGEALDAGWIDVAPDLVLETSLDWSARPDMGYVESEAVSATRLVINMRDPVFQSAEVRRGLNQAIDAERLSHAAVAASPVVAAGAIPPSLPGAEPSREPYRFNPERARALLLAGGYPFDRPLRLRVPAPGLSEFPPQIGTLLADYLEAVGIRVELTVSSTDIEEVLASGAADLVLEVWVGDYPDGDAFLYPLYHSRVAGAAANSGAYTNPELDRLIDASRRELDAARRAQLLRAADQLVFDDAPIVFLWFTRSATAYSLRLTGWGRDPQMSRLFRLRLASAPSGD